MARFTLIKNKPRGFRVSAIIINEKNEILLMKRIFKNELFYELPGGGVEKDELLEDACIREIKEEFNILIVPKRIAYILDSVHRLNFVFECEYLEGEVSLGGPEKERMNESDQYYPEWISIKKLSEINLLPSITKEALLRYLSNKNQPIFLVNNYPEFNKNVLIIAPKEKEIPPTGYGGIERIVTLVYLHYLTDSYNVEIVSKEGSKFHNYNHDEIETLNFDKYRFIISFCYDERILRLLDEKNPQVFVILENNYSEKFAFFKNLKNTIFYTISQAQQEEYYYNLGIKYEIIPNGIDMDFFRILNIKRTKDIVFIGVIGQHKSPLSCLNYARKYNLSIDFYGPIVFREDEKEYEKTFMEEISKYPKAKLCGEILDDFEKLKILNEYKFFIFLPGIDKKSWVEPFGLAPLEAMACGCIPITHYEKGGHLSYLNKQNSISYLEEPRELDIFFVRESIKEFDFKRIFKLYYPK